MVAAPIAADRIRVKTGITADVGRPDASDAALIDRLVAPGGLRAVFQPIVRLADGELIGYEALSRATADVGVPTSDWFPIAARLGRQVELEQACLAAIAEGGAPPQDVLLFVNVSPALLADPASLALRDKLPRRLVLELTERDEVRDIEALRTALEPWLRSGARLAIDDAGAGYSSLQQVVHLLPEFIKLDRSLITGIHEDRPRQALVAALVGFASEIGANLIAEGVETRAELAWLRNSDVALVQGYLLAEPAEPWCAPVDIGPARQAVGGATFDRLHRQLRSARTQRDACEAVAAHLFRRGGLMPSVYLEMGGRLRCQAQRGLWQVLDGMSPNAGITGLTFRTGRAHDLDDLGEVPDYLEAIPGVVAELCVPITGGDAVIGALNVESLVPLSEIDRAEVSSCAALLSARLADLAPDQSKVPLRRLATTAASLVAGDDFDGTAMAVLMASCELSGMDSAMLALRTPDGRLEIQHAAGPLASALGAMSEPELEHLWKVLEPLTSCYTAGDATGRTVTASDTLREAGARALLALPLIARGRRTGLIVITNRDPLPLGPEQVEPLELLAILAGSCVEMANTLGELRDRARLDPLTGLGNHSSFHEALGRIPAGAPASLIVLDIDGFKWVNDTLGHLRGDELLRETGRRLGQVAADPQAVFRIGGDEFAVLLTQQSAPVAEALASALTASAGHVLTPMGAALSAGVAHRVDDEPLLVTLERADAALYRSKRAVPGPKAGRHRAHHDTLPSDPTAPELAVGAPS